MKNHKLENRKIYIDFLKIIAVYMVLFNHTGTDGFVLFTIARTSKLYSLYLFNAIFITIAVPIFFMASGALLLSREESYEDIIKRFFKYLIALLIGSLVAYLYTYFCGDREKISASQFLKEVYSTKLITSYWYLYTYLAYILMLPFLRKLAKAMSNKDYKWMFLMYSLMKALSIFEFIIWKGTLSHNSNFSFFILTNYIFYPLTGYYIDQRIKKEKFTEKNVLALMTASIMAIIVSCLMTQYQCTLIGEWKEATCQTFFSTLIFIPSITVFLQQKCGLWIAN